MSVDEPIVLSDTDEDAEPVAAEPITGGGEGSAGGGGSGEVAGAESDCTIEDEPILAETGASGPLPPGSGVLHEAQQGQQVRQPSADELRAAS